MSDGAAGNEVSGTRHGCLTSASSGRPTAALRLLLRAAERER